MELKSRLDLTEIFCDVDDVLIQSLQVGEPAQRAESLFIKVLNNIVVQFLS